jgi:hypothetical protein
MSSHLLDQQLRNSASNAASFANTKEIELQQPTATNSAKDLYQP